MYTSQKSQELRQDVQQWLIHGLINQVHLNGELVAVRILPDDSDGVTVALSDRLLRLSTENLRNPVHSGTSAVEPTAKKARGLA